MTCDLQRIKALEVGGAATRNDLERVDKILRLTPMKPRLKKQKGAIEGDLSGVGRDREVASAGWAAKSTDSLGNKTNHISRD